MQHKITKLPQAVAQKNNTLLKLTNNLIYSPAIKFCIRSLTAHQLTEINGKIKG